MTARRGWLVAALLGLAALCNAASDDSLTPDEHRRGPDQTFLTFPEWFLVHSPAEYANYLSRADRPSSFPLFSHIGQFWQSYGAVNREIERYPFNGGYHLMVLVIGSSTTVEYSLKGLYERSIGRLAEATKSTARVPEEDFAAHYAQDYVDFIRVEPWYKFDFLSQLRYLWSAPLPLRGPDLLRRWERRYILSTELLAKEGYARLIKLGTQTVYDAPKPTTAIVLDRAPVPDAKGHPDLQILNGTLPAGEVLALLPRYEAFSTYSRWLAEQDVRFVEVAGNRGDILISLIVRDAWKPSQGRLVFEQPVLTRPGIKRAVIAVPVASLSRVLQVAAAHRDGVEVEHVYDF